MGKTKYSKSVEVLQLIKKEYGEIISLENLKIGIMKYIGSDEIRTIKPTMQLMLATNLIKQEGALIRII